MCVRVLRRSISYFTINSITVTDAKIVIINVWCTGQVIVNREYQQNPRFQLQLTAALLLTI